MLLIARCILRLQLVTFPILLSILSILLGTDKVQQYINSEDKAETSNSFLHMKIGWMILIAPSLMIQFWGSLCTIYFAGEVIFLPLAAPILAAIALLWHNLIKPNTSLFLQYLDYKHPLLIGFIQCRTLTTLALAYNFLSFLIYALLINVFFDTVCFYYGQSWSSCVETGLQATYCRNSSVPGFWFFQFNQSQNHWKHWFLVLSWWL